MQSLTIFTDCRSIVCKFLEIASNPHDKEFRDLWNFSDISHIKIRLISSELNSKVDHLAKLGAKSGNSKRYWVHGARQP